MAVYPFITTAAQATALAKSRVKQMTLDAVFDAAVAQLNGAKTFALDTAGLATKINTFVQGMATDTQQPITHPVTGKVVAPVPSVAVKPAPVSPAKP